LQLMLTVVILLEKLVRQLGILEIIKTAKANLTKTALGFKQRFE